MAITRFDPFRDLAVLQDRMNRLFNDSYGSRNQEDHMLNRGTWVPPVDIWEAEGELVLKAELPDMKREDIDVTVENNTLTIKGERRRDDTIDEDRYHRLERAYGAFSRSFTLPNTLDGSRVRAEYRDGVLTIVLPLREEARPRQIQVEVKN